VVRPRYAFARSSSAPLREATTSWKIGLQLSSNPAAAAVWPGRAAAYDGAVLAQAVALLPPPGMPFGKTEHKTSH
jgi:hypothetical protein